MQTSEPAETSGKPAERAPCNAVSSLFHTDRFDIFTSLTQPTLSLISLALIMIKKCRWQRSLEQASASAWLINLGLIF